MAYQKIAEIKSKAKTPKGILKALKKVTEFVEEYTEEEIKTEIESGFIQIKNNKITLWEEVY